MNHHGTHRHLLATPSGVPASGRVDAIIVPTVRPPAYLQEAAHLAAQLNCRLVVVCSGRWTSASQVLRAFGGHGTELVAVDLPRHRWSPVPLKTSRLLRGSPLDRRADTAAKRNLGLVLARLAGWDRVIFLDDDIAVPDPDDLRRAAWLLGDYDRVALSMAGFPDNSVVCHAHRRTGGAQESFIGSGAMALDPARAPSFFPVIYNEDWLDLLDGTGMRRTAVVGTAVQRPYDPYRSPDRARTEEFGEVIAEGLFRLLDDGEPLTGADGDFWKEFLAGRRRLLKQISHRARHSVRETEERERIRTSLQAAHEQHQHITAKLCSGFLDALTTDREDWQAYLHVLPSGLALDKSCAELADRYGGAQVLHSEPAGAPARAEVATPPPHEPWAVVDPLTRDDYITVRPLTEGDLRQVIDVLGEEPYFVRALARQRERHGMLLVVWAGTEPIGDVYIWLGRAEEKRLRRRLNGTPLLTHLELVPRYRGLGLTPVILHAAEQWLIGQGRSRLALGVDMDNHTLFKLYRALGFKRWRYSPIPTTAEVFQEDGTSERLPDKCRILHTSLSAFPAELR
ncbi:GNAT family N-acetyltransferase [Nonomuraea glycinis]|uniref:GNAT family N-acetyltransferase n=1 Tax=Nonomuraea glycinis TaxID=2047744 RepID=UPI002E149FD7|nr:GNAT family N-acetyltransferase [Nonomuraea glycinis]